ncbi:MAG: hypothetical protein EZS28_038718, partial [Streblomastix strix]
FHPLPLLVQMIFFQAEVNVRKYYTDIHGTKRMCRRFNKEIQTMHARYQYHKSERVFTGKNTLLEFALELAEYSEILNDKFNGFQTWQFPKGKIEPGETGIQCYVREILEETGLNIENYITEQSKSSTTKENEHQLTMYVIFGVNDKLVLYPTVREETGRLECLLIND